jgi:hypothetical protein
MRLQLETIRLNIAAQRVTHVDAHRTRILERGVTLVVVDIFGLVSALNVVSDMDVRFSCAFGSSL